MLDSADFYIILMMRNMDATEPQPKNLIIGRLRFIFVAIVTIATLVPYYIIWNVSGIILRKYHYGLIRSWFSWILMSAGARIDTVIDSSFDISKPYIGVSNHLSYFDIPATAYAVPVDWRFIAMRSLFYVPLLNSGLKHAQMISIDRKSPEAAYQSLDRAAKQVIKGHTVLIYPEGGISPNGRLQPFKKGAFYLAIRSGIPILPIVLIGSNDVFSIHRKESHPGTIRIKVLEPIPTDGLGEQEIPELQERVRRIMIEAGATE